jgi:hypothetical protein
MPAEYWNRQPIAHDASHLRDPADQVFAPPLLLAYRLSIIERLIDFFIKTCPASPQHRV